MMSSALGMPMMELQALGLESLLPRSAAAAPDRATYLQRPDLGRQLDAASRPAPCTQAPWR